MNSVHTAFVLPWLALACVVALIPIDQLFRALTDEEVLEQFLTILESAGMPARSWRKAGVARTILRVVAILYGRFTVVMVAFIRSGFLDTAEGIWLTRLAYFVYGVERRSASFANGKLKITNNGAGFFDEPPGTVRVRSPATKKVYVNTEQVVLTPGQSLSFDFEAVEIGPDSSAAVGTITEFVVVLFDCTVTNEVAFIGFEEEKDPDLRQACRDKVATRTVRGGPRGAYAYAIRVAKRPSGAPVNINRSRISRSSSKGIVDVYVAAPSGTPDPDDLDYIRDSIEEWARPDAVTANVYATTVKNASRELTVWAYRTPGLAADDLATLVLNAILRDTSTFPVGGQAKQPSTQGYYYADHLDAVVHAAHEKIFDVDGSGADISLEIGEVLNLTTTVTVRFSEAPS